MLYRRGKRRNSNARSEGKSMGSYKLIALSNAIEGRDDEFNAWYGGEHVADLLAIPGVVSAQRYRLATAKGKYRYLAVYDIEADDVNEPINELRRRLRAGEILLHESMQQDDILLSAFEAI